MMWQVGLAESQGVPEEAAGAGIRVNVHDVAGQHSIVTVEEYGDMRCGRKPASLNQFTFCKRFVSSMLLCVNASY